MNKTQCSNTNADGDGSDSSSNINKMEMAMIMVTTKVHQVPGIAGEALGQCFCHAIH